MIYVAELWIGQSMVDTILTKDKDELMLWYDKKCRDAEEEGLCFVQLYINGRKLNFDELADFWQ